MGQTVSGPRSKEGKHLAYTVQGMAFRRAAEVFNGRKLVAGTDLTCAVTLGPDAASTGLSPETSIEISETQGMSGETESKPDQIAEPLTSRRQLLTCDPKPELLSERQATI